MNPDISPAILIPLAILWIVITILWLLLPFAVFGIKGRLDRLIDLTRTQNKLLEQNSRAASETPGRRDPTL